MALPSKFENLLVEIPTGLDLHDVERINTRAGHVIVWLDSAGSQHVLGKLSVSGPGLTD